MGSQNLRVLSLWVASRITLFPYSDSWEQEVLGRVLSRYPFLISWNYLSLCKTVLSLLHIVEQPSHTATGKYSLNKDCMI